MFKETYSKITEGNSNWNSLEASESMLYPWDTKSTYVKSPPFFDSMSLEVPSIESVEKASVLLNLGDSVTTGKYVACKFELLTVFFGSAWRHIFKAVLVQSMNKISGFFYLIICRYNILQFCYFSVFSVLVKQQ